MQELNDKITYFELEVAELQGKMDRIIQELKDLKEETNYEDRCKPKNWNMLQR